MRPFSPSPFGKYFLVDKIATGGMAEIFKAKSYGHGGFESLLVIKRILPHVGENEDFVEMFIDEAKVSVALQHPNIVKVFDFGQQADNYFIAMECVDGKDVRGILKKLTATGKRLPWVLACAIAHETSRGLHYAHTKTDMQGRSYEIVHRDIGPANILVGYDGQVKIADFGIAKAESNAYQTRDGVLKGKFEYMSPEQASGKPLDHRSDQFAVGILLWECLTGQRLFRTDNDIATLRKITEGTIEAPSVVNPDVPVALDAVVMRALEKDPEARYPDTASLAEDLREVMLPAAPEDARDQLAVYMAELFETEIADEMERLAANSAVALQLRASGQWDQTTSIRPPAPPAPRFWPVLLLILAVAVGTASLAVVGVVVTVSQTAQQTSRLAAIDVLVEPEARVFVDGTLRGTGNMVTVSRLEPGEHQLRIEADGHEPKEHTVTVTDGQALRYEAQLVALVPGPDAVPEPSPETPEPIAPVADGPPRIRFVSEPSGATVVVDGRTVGTTPMTFRAKPGERLAVRLEAEGYAAVEGQITAGELGSSTAFERTLPEVREPGTLAVLLVGGGWAHVWVDGTKLSKTAPLRGVALEVGTHEIRVQNEALGVDHTQTVTVGSGESVTVRAAPK